MNEKLDFLKNEYSFNMRLSNVKTRKDRMLRGRRIKSSAAFEIRTTVSPTFNKLRDLWYPNNVKIVPRTLQLTPTTALHWYLGDGSLDNHQGLIFCTDSFDASDIDFLICLLCYENIKARRYKNNRILIPNIVAIFLSDYDQTYLGTGLR